MAQLGGDHGAPIIKGSVDMGLIQTGGPYRQGAHTEKGSIQTSGPFIIYPEEHTPVPPKIHTISDMRIIILSWFQKNSRGGMPHTIFAINIDIFKLFLP